MVVLENRVRSNDTKRLSQRKWLNSRHHIFYGNFPVTALSNQGRLGRTVGINKGLRIALGRQ